MAIVEREDNIRCQLANALNPQGMINLVRGVNRNTGAGREAGNRSKKRFFTRIVGVRKNGSDFITCIQQGLDTLTSHIVIGKYDGFHARFSSVDCVVCGRITC
ncbi:hypothetical protein SDC9_198721 [bioreactor metagenome]|uniref:Uncharacterized protein n=1 Tax=bioreactor metagenome TaxID=1076179 RepID=A0A645IIX9_9ZZZZ